MSIYSGFPTRKHETFYNRILFKAIETLSTELAKFYSRPDNEGGSVKGDQPSLISIEDIDDV